MTINQLVREKREAIQQIAARHGAYNIRLFGSTVRGDDTAKSDIDLLEETGPETSSWFPAGLVLDLQDILGRRVEVVTEKAINPAIRENVLREAKPI